MVGGAVALVIGGVSAVAGFSAVQSQGASNFAFALDLARPAINSGFSAVGAEEIQAPDTGDGASTIAVAALVLGSALAAAGLCLLAMGFVWTLARWSPRERGRDVYSRAQPIASGTVSHGKRQAMSAAGFAKRGTLKASPVVARALRRARDRVTNRRGVSSRKPAERLPRGGDDPDRF